MTDSRPHSVHAYYRAILEAYAQADPPAYHQLSPEQAREMLRTSLAAAPPQTDLPALAAVETITVSAADCEIPVRRYRPVGDVRGLCVFFHAGGWVIGDLDTPDPLCRRLAAGSGCEVVSVEYRKAPEYPYPAALDDAWTVLHWVASETDKPLVIAGESAGGNLAAACAIRARDEGFDRLAGQFLAYPVTDHDFTTPSYREMGGQDYLLSETDMRWFWDQYCPAGTDRADPLVSPLRIPRCEDLPPAFICVAHLDPLRDEGLAYAARLAAAGVSVQSRCDRGMLHGYLSAAGAVPLAADALKQAAQWMDKCVSREMY